MKSCFCFHFRLLSLLLLSSTLQTAFLQPQDGNNEMPATPSESKSRISVDTLPKHLEFPSGRTKNSLPQTVQNESNICFPYFIAQDVDALLAQASRKLNKAVDHRERSWLQLFVHRLDSLSRQLRSLPTEHKNMCFRKRQRILSGSSIQNDVLDLTPEEIQLRFAKQLFDTRGEIHRPRVFPQQYVTGRISERQLRNRPVLYRHRASLNPTSLGYEYNMGSIPNEANGYENSNIHRESNSKRQRPMPRRVIPYTTQNPVQISSSSSGSPEMQAKPLFTSYSFNPAEVNENTPFLPRSTRKTIPRQILEKLKYSNQERNGNIDSERPTYVFPETPGPKKQSEHEQTNNHSSEKIVEASGAILTVPNTETKSERSPQSIASSDLGSSNNRAQTNAMGPTSSQMSPTKPVSNNYMDDDIVMQLHAGVSTTQTVSVTQVPNEVAEWTSAKAEATVEATDSPRKVQGQTQDGVERPDVNIKPLNVKPHPYELFDESGTYRRPYNEENNLDFDYEEEGAAFGELYTEEDAFPLKNIAIPSSTEKLVNINTDARRQTTDADEDDAVLQLRALKSPSTTEDVSALSSGLPPQEKAPHLKAGPAGRIHRRDDQQKPFDNSLADDKK